MSDDAARVLLVGKDARTDALAEACERDAGVELTVCLDLKSPGLLARCKDVRMVRSLRNVEAILAHAREVEPEFVVVGPEDPLEAGLADALEAEGIACFGPRKELAKIETSKGWARGLLARAGIPGLPDYRYFQAAEGMAEYVVKLGACVVKPDGLTGGKGVKVMGEHLNSAREAVAYARELVEREGSVVIEERLEGEEFSLQSITDGESVVHCPLAQDHKRAFDGDAGPNTGGMGSYSCEDHSLPFLTAGEVAEARRINEAVVEALQSETGMPYRGVLYGGFMATRDGVRVIEYNARFGDPEALNVLPLLETSFVELARAVVAGRLGAHEARFARRASVCKYLVPDGYPERPRKGDLITVDRRLADKLGARLYFASVDASEGALMMTGSRAVAVVGVADTVAEAERIAEEATVAVMGPVRHRRDIGTAALVDSRVAHMTRVRGGLPDPGSGDDLPPIDRPDDARPRGKLSPKPPFGKRP
jgi:phosphoribosylamine--glycine ligase